MNIYIAFEIAVALIAGIVFARLLGLGYEPHRRWQRLPVGLIWIGIAGIVFWALAQDVDLTNMLCASMLVGFLARCFWEWVLYRYPVNPVNDCHPDSSHDAGYPSGSYVDTTIYGHSPNPAPKDKLVLTTADGVTTVQSWDAARGYPDNPSALC